MLPRDLIYRPKKGFSMPVAAWLRNDLRGDVENLGRNDVLANSGLIDGTAVQRMAREHLSGTFDHARPLWLLFAFAAFLRHVAAHASAPRTAVVA